MDKDNNDNGNIVNVVVRVDATEFDAFVEKVKQLVEMLNNTVTVAVNLNVDNDTT